MSDFEIKVIDQYWINELDSCNEYDLCSHGHIYLKINDTIITNKLESDWTLSTTALMLLRSCFNDRDKLNEPIILHCGQIYMTGCPISINWETAITDNEIHISNISKLLTLNKQDIQRYEKLDVVVSKKEYFSQVKLFCTDVLNFFEGLNKDPGSELEFYQQFWQEFHDRLSKI